MERIKFFLHYLLACLYLAFMIIGCSPKQSNPDYAQNNSSLVKKVIVGGENVLSTNPGFQNTYIIDETIYLFNAEKDIWYGLNPNKNLLIASTKRFLSESEIIESIGSMTGEDPKYIAVFPSPSNKKVIFTIDNANSSKITGLPTQNDQNYIGLIPPVGVNYFDIYILDVSTQKFHLLGQIFGDPVNVVWSPKEIYAVLYRNSIEAHQVGGDFGLWLVNTNGYEFTKIFKNLDSGSYIIPKLVSDDGNEVIYVQIGVNSRTFLFDRMTNTSTLLDINLTPQLWWYSDDVFLFLVKCEQDNQYKLNGYFVTKKQIIQSDPECFDINWSSSFFLSSAEENLIVYRHNGSNTLFIREINVK